MIEMDLSSQTSSILGDCVTNILFNDKYQVNPKTEAIINKEDYIKANVSQLEETRSAK